MVREDDVQLIHDILSGNDAAFNALVQKYHKSVHALVWQKINDFHYAEEITQDTFLQAYKKLRTLKDPRQFSGWLYVIANRLCIDWTRKQRPAMQSLWETPTKEIEKSCYAWYVTEKQETEAATYRHEIVNELLDRLPENERRVMKLYYLDEMTAKEIGKFLGVSANTISSRLQRARKRLQTDKELQVQEFFGGVQMSENMVKNVKQQITAFRERTKSDPLSGEDILTEACNQVEGALKDEITPELVHLADEIYEYMGILGYEKSVSLHRRYIGASPDNAERFWSHSLLMVNLYMLGRNREVVEEQSRLYHWTCEHLPDDYVLEVLGYHLNETGCWTAEGRIDEWFQLYEEASERLDNPQVDRYKRCGFLQTGAEVLMHNDRLDETLLAIEKLERFNDDPDWEYYRQYWLGVITTRLRVHSKLEDWTRFDQVFTEASTFIEGEVEKRNAGHSVNRMDLAWIAHDVGACLMWSKKHKEAKHLLQVAIDFNNDPGTHFYLAANIWTSEKDRENTLHHLKIAQDLERNPWNQHPFLQFFLETPEFSDVKDDKEFLKVLGQK